MKISAVLISLGLAALGLTAPARAATLAADCTNPAVNLQSVIDSAAPADTIVVLGTCIGQFTIIRSLTLAGGFGGTLDGNGTGTALTVNVAAPDVVTVNSLGITNGSAPTGGGVVKAGSGTLALTDVEISNNVGGGIANLAGTLMLTSALLTLNSANPTGGGIFNDKGAILVVTRILATVNTAATKGGAIDNLGSGSVTESSITANRAGVTGGGICNEKGSTHLMVSKSIITANSPNNEC
jgi:hypothetical protein